MALPSFILALIIPSSLNEFSAPVHWGEIHVHNITTRFQPLDTWCKLPVDTFPNKNMLKSIILIGGPFKGNIRC